MRLPQVRNGTKSSTKKGLSRRGLLGLLAAVVSLPKRVGRVEARQERRGAASGTRVDRWHRTNDRVWLGDRFWANPMEDWRVVDGAAEVQTSGGDRNVHLITHRLTGERGRFRMSVRCRRVEAGERDGGVGFRIGVRNRIDDHRSNCFARGVGVDAGLVDGRLVLGGASSEAADGEAVAAEGIILVLEGRTEGQDCELSLTARTASGSELGNLTHTVPAADVVGNVAIVSNFDREIAKGEGARYRFSEWTVDGDAFEVSDDRRFGPIQWSMYSMSDSRGDEGFVVKLTALLPPLGKEDGRRVELHTEHDGEWRSDGFAELDPDAWTATFRLTNWNARVAAPFRIVYRERHTDGGETEHEWRGTIRADPAGRPLRLAGLTCQNDYSFPYAPVADHVLARDPDLLFFSGDQLYENHGGYGLIREPAEPAILNYLRKYYMFGWAFRETMRDRPTLCIPDDHDVFQGNIWGEGGKAMDTGRGTSSLGGYREPARMVNVVHRTNASHHPDPFDPAPVDQDISVYYGDMVYGGVGFAVLADRQFKSGPEHVDTGSGRADHVLDESIDTSTLDQPGLALLGERQEEFLEKWAGDWRGHTMKVLLSQTVFAGVATHHGGHDDYLIADLDCGGWPQTPRNRLVRILRKAKCLHVCGDQHLPSLVQYGADAQRDGCWAFCTPAISAGYPRWWRPDEVGTPHRNRPRHGLAHTGEFRDPLGNRVYVYAIGNPEVGTAPDPYERAHQKSSGFGLVTVDTEAKTYRIEAFRFLSTADSSDGESAQFPGWPVTVHQDENAGENRIG
ncbi:MAG: alkaline phosphatase D family protein [Acidobacteria bacterium]|nr:alkaline phosphatase D family protein [Acidobacteriota bacterium]